MTTKHLHNRIDPQAVDAYLAGFAAPETEVGRLLHIALRNLLMNRDKSWRPVEALPQDAPDWLRKKWPAPEGAAPYTKFQPEPSLKNKVRHIRDWLTAAVDDEDPWIGKVNKAGLPQKLLYFASLDDVTRMANEELDRKALEGGPVVERVAFSSRQFVNRLGEAWHGYHVVEMLSPGAFDAESEALGHCIGKGSTYDKKLKQKTSRFYSLRGPNNERLATFELDVKTRTIEQCEGQDYNPPARKYSPLIGAFLQHNRYHIGEETNFIGWIEQEGQYCDVMNLPENLHWPGNLNLGGLPLRALPKGLKVEGDLDIRDTRIHRLPEGLWVGGDLDAEGQMLYSMPKDLHVGGYLIFNKRSWRNLPKGLSVGGAYGGEMDGEYGGDGHEDFFDLSHSELEWLPENMTVIGNLHLYNTRIRQLPKGLKVTGDLDLSNTPFLREIPADLVVMGNLVLKGSGIKHLPEGLTVRQALELDESKIKDLPRRLNVGQVVSASNTSLATLPDDIMHCGAGLFDFSKTKLRTLPVCDTWPGSLYIHDTPIEKLNTKRIKGSLAITGTQVQSLPEGFRVDKDLWAENTPLTNLPARMHVGGKLNILGTGIKRIPQGVEYKELLGVPEGYVQQATPFDPAAIVAEGPKRRGGRSRGD